MSLFSTEPFANIFVHLDQHDKVNCMLVCHDWKNITQEFVLYYTLCFYTLPSLKLFTKKIQEQPEIGKKVEKLIIKMENGESPINLTPLFLSLANLESLYFASHHDVVATLEEHIHYPFHNHIKHLYLGSQYFGRSFMSSKYPNLKSLVVSHDAVSQLNNLTALTKLELQNFVATFGKLEEIHGGAPHLESLLITSGEFSDVRKEYKDTIIPATSVTTFVLCIQHMRPDNDRTKNNILKYLHRKYPALSSLTFKFAVPGEVHSHYINAADRDGWIHLLHQLGPQLKRLVMDYDGCMDRPLQTFDKAGCQVEYFRMGYFPVTLFVEMMMPSQQLHFIQTLVLDLIPRMKVPGFGWLKKLVVLKKLKLSGSHSLKFNKILENCPPFLRVLSFRSTSLEWTDRCLEPCRQIETLSLDHTQIQDGFDVFISRCFPRLSKLKLKHCDLLSKRFDLQALDLAYFYFTDRFVNWKNGIIVWTTCDH
jgi:Leucine-rich repeat (LRR) protein